MDDRTRATPRWTLLVALLSACAGSSEAPEVLVATTASGLYDLELSFLDPVVVGEVAAELALVDEVGAVEGADLTVDAYMPLHGHGLTDEPAVVELGGGSYTASWVFPMSGTWEVTVLVDAERGADTAVIDVDVR